MAKDKAVKKEKHDKPLHSKTTSDGISKEKSKSKRDKHNSSSSKSISPEHADRLLQDLSTSSSTSIAAAPIIVPAPNAKTNGNTVDNEEEEDEAMPDMSESTDPASKPHGALVPFANPLADSKTAKKVFKSVKKAHRARSLKRGVKEVVKTLRKSALSTPSSLASTSPSAVVVIAADISPMDVISHLPVLCEDHGVPYVYVSSRAELGAAGATKRPTSVVLVGREKGKAGKAKEREKDGEEGKEGKEDWAEVYHELVRVVRKAGRGVRI